MISNYICKIQWFLPVATALLVGCGDAPKSEETINVTSEDTIAGKQDGEARLEKAKNIFYMIPSPIETVSLLKKAGAEYHGDILNNPQASGDYETGKIQALNLGIYGADLAYASLFDQTQEATFFVQSCKHLAEGLGIMNAFDESTLQRIEDNINDQDSMLHIIADAYWLANAYLKENQKINTSALIIVGGWLEGLHIALNVASNNSGNAALTKRIAEQKYSMHNLVDLIESYEQDAALDSVLADLRSLEALFDQLEIVKTAGEHSVDENGVAIIGGTREIKMTKEQLSVIETKVNEIRGKYIE